MSFSCPLPDLAATEALARKLAPELKRGDFLALKGLLGAGKTAFARALLRALGINDEAPSPTFTLVQMYDSRNFPIYHFDLYRLKSAAELEELGWEDALADGLVIAEWPERAEGRLPENYLALQFMFDDKARHCLIEAHGAWAARLKGFA